MCPQVDALIIGGGIMGTTVALMLKLLQPKWKVKLVKQHDRVAQEASNEWHNAGTGHAALCEPNYTPMNAQGEVEIDKAVATNQKVGSWLRVAMRTCILSGALRSTDFPRLPC